MPLTHFIGVASDQYQNAVRIFGVPDFIHGRATWSCMGEIDRHDLVILGRGAFPQVRKWKRKNLTAHSLTQPTGEKL